MQGKRIVGYDLAKTIAMLFVVLLHSSFYACGFKPTGLTCFVISFTVVCVPLFICVNGAILLNKKLDINRHIRKCIHTLALLFIWRFIHIVIYRFMFNAPSIGLSQLITLMFGGNVDGYLMGHFWFINALISIYIMLPIIKHLWDSNNWTLLGFICVPIFVFFFVTDGVRAVFDVTDSKFLNSASDSLSFVTALQPFGVYGYLFIYFITGGFIGKYLLNQNEGLFKHYSIRQVLISSFIVYLVSSLITGALHFAQCSKNGFNFAIDFGYWLPSTFFSTVSLFVLLISIGMLLKSLKILQISVFFGSNTFAVYMLHMFILLSLQTVTGIIQVQNFNVLVSLLLQFVLVIASFVLLSVCGEILKKVPLLSNLFKF